MGTSCLKLRVSTLGDASVFRSKTCHPLCRHRMQVCPYVCQDQPSGSVNSVSESLLVELSVASRFLKSMTTVQIKQQGRRRRGPTHYLSKFHLGLLALVMLPVLSLSGLCELAAKGIVSSLWVASEVVNIVACTLFPGKQVFKFNPWIVGVCVMPWTSVLFLAPPIASIFIDINYQSMVRASWSVLASFLFPIYGVTSCYLWFGRGFASFAAAGASLFRVYTLYHWCCLGHYNSIAYRLLNASTFCGVFLMCLGMLSSALWSEQPTALL